jgi:hypothetical protein
MIQQYYDPIKYRVGLSDADLSSIENYAKGNYGGYDEEESELNPFLAYAEEE